MPELPEVSIIVNGLNNKLKGLVLKSIEYDWPKKFFWGRRPGGASGSEGKYAIKDIKGKRVEKVERIGKIVVIELSNAKRLKTKVKRKKSVSHSSLDISRVSVLIHLKLTGQLIYQDAKTRIAGGHPIPPLNLPVPNKTTRVTFEFTNGGHLYFNDMRKFGWVRIVESGKLKVESFLENLGPDALEIKYEEFSARLKKKPNARIKKLLMDQSFVAGVGNIYSDEALWLAKIHPRRSVISLSDKEIRALFDGVRDSMNLAISKGGSSANAYVDSGGERGLYLSYANAYHMTGKPCARCKTSIVRQKMDGRSAHFCPKCQVLK